MKRGFVRAGCVAAAWLFSGCAEIPPPGVEAGPHGTIAYYVSIDASPPGARILANRSSVGVTPLTLKIFGDKDGTFHDFGSYTYVVQAFPLTTNQFVQTRVYRTGRMFTPEDKIPQRIYFDMSLRPGPYPYPGYPPYAPPVYYAPPPYYYWPPAYYWPRYRYW